MQDRHLNLLIDMYMEEDWRKIHHVPQAIRQYIDTKIERADKGYKRSVYRLNPAGVRYVERYMRSMGRNTGPVGGIAVQRRSWDQVHHHVLPAEDLVEAFHELAKLANLRLETEVDMNGNHVVITKDIDAILSRVGYEIQWETMGVIPDDWTDAMGFVWTYLDGIRPYLRRVPLQQEFVIWQDS